MIEENSTAVATMVGAIIGAFGTLLGVIAVTVGNVISKIMDRKTEKIKLTYTDRGKGLYYVLSLCDEMRMYHDPTDYPDYRWLQSLLPKFDNIKQYYYALDGNIVKGLEEIYENISYIHFFGHEQFDSSEVKSFFEKEFQDAIAALRREALTYIKLK